MRTRSLLKVRACSPTKAKARTCCPLKARTFMMSRSPGLSLDERMLRALSFFKESAGGGILAQVWVPIKDGDQFILSTSEQPYLLDQMLAGYREVSRTFTFSTEGKSGCFLGLPGRVFTSKVPEWTSNVGYYSMSEYLRFEHAINHKVRGSIAIPIFDLHSEFPCCAVLELLTTKEKPDFDRELEIVRHALQVSFSFSSVTSLSAPFASLTASHVESDGSWWPSP